jgi:hypothetical protein
MQYNLSFGPEFVLVHASEMMAVKDTKICLGVECGEHKPSLRMKDSTKFPYKSER